MDYLKITDQSVESKTGKNWKGWFAILDQMKAQEIGHTQTAKNLLEQYGLTKWWAQVVTIRYEKEKGYWQKSWEK